MTTKSNNTNLPLCDKYLLTLKEASLYFNIGINKIREITDDTDNDCVIFINSKRMIKRKKFEKWLDKQTYL